MLAGCDADISIRPERAAAEVVEQLRALKVRRLFVVDRAGKLVGVISAGDVLGHLRTEADANQD